MATIEVEDLGGERRSHEIIDVDRVQVLHIEPGDVIVCRTECALSVDETERIKARFKSALPDHDVIVVPLCQEVFLGRPTVPTRKKEQCRNVR